MKIFDINEMTNEERLKLELFAEKGIVGNPALKESVDNDRIESVDSDGKVTIYPSLDAAAEILTEKNPEKKAMIKFRIRKSIINQSNDTIFGLHWSENVEDYLKRVK